MKHECVIMGDFNLLHIDCSLQQPIPAPGSKLLQFFADNGLSRHVQKPTRQNDINFDIGITTEEALLVTLQIKDKIGDHQAIQFLLQLEKEETTVEKTNYNFRRANFETMRADLDDERLLRLIVNSDAAQGFKLLKNKILEYCRRHIPKKHITHHGSTMMSSSPSQDVREPIMKERGTKLTKPVLNTSLLDGWLKAQRSKPNATRKSILQDYAKLTLKASTSTSMTEELSEIMYDHSKHPLAILSPLTMTWPTL